MCSIIVASRLWAQWPLVIAANRDESLTRASEGLSVRTHGASLLLAPRDAVAGGTWLGLNRDGLFVGITNRFDARAQGATFPGSRGQVVLDALAEPTARAAAAGADRIDPAHQGPFHLVMADRDGAELRWSDTATIHRRTLGPGVHVVTERSFEAAPTRREPWLARALAEVADGPPPTVEQWGRWLSHHDDAPLEGTCVHADARGYGTRSSTIVMLGAQGITRVLHAEGPPCRTPYVDHDGLVGALHAGA